MHLIKIIYKSRKIKSLDLDAQITANAARLTAPDAVKLWFQWRPSKIVLNNFNQLQIYKPFCCRIDRTLTYKPKCTSKIENHPLM